MLFTKKVRIAAGHLSRELERSVEILNAVRPGIFVASALERSLMHWGVADLADRIPDSTHVILNISNATEEPSIIYLLSMGCYEDDGPNPDFRINTPNKELKCGVRDHRLPLDYARIGGMADLFVLYHNKTIPLWDREVKQVCDEYIRLKQMSAATIFVEPGNGFNDGRMYTTNGKSVGKAKPSPGDVKKLLTYML